MSLLTVGLCKQIAIPKHVILGCCCNINLHWNEEVFHGAWYQTLFICEHIIYIYFILCQTFNKPIVKSTLQNVYRGNFNVLSSPLACYHPLLIIYNSLLTIHILTSLEISNSTLSCNFMQPNVFFSQMSRNDLDNNINFICADFRSIIHTQTSIYITLSKLIQFPGEGTRGNLLNHVRKNVRYFLFICEKIYTIL